MLLLWWWISGWVVGIVFKEDFVYITPSFLSLFSQCKWEKRAYSKIKKKFSRESHSFLFYGLWWGDKESSNMFLKRMKEEPDDLNEPYLSHNEIMLFSTCPQTKFGGLESHTWNPTDLSGRHVFHVLSRYSNNCRNSTVTSWYNVIVQWDKRFSFRQKVSKRSNNTQLVTRKWCFQPQFSTPEDIEATEAFVEEWKHETHSDREITDYNVLCPQTTWTRRRSTLIWS